jgi:hypothetical protein
MSRRTRVRATAASTDNQLSTRSLDPRTESGHSEGTRPGVPTTSGGAPSRSAASLRLRSPRRQRCQGDRPPIRATNDSWAVGSTGLGTTFVEGGKGSRGAPSIHACAGRTGRRSKPPPQFRHTFDRTASTQSRQNVHSYEQIIASVALGASGRLQFSHVGRSSSSCRMHCHGDGARRYRRVRRGQRSCRRCGQGWDRRHTGGARTDTSIWTRSRHHARSARGGARSRGSRDTASWSAAAGTPHRCSAPTTPTPSGERQRRVPSSSNAANGPVRATPCDGSTTARSVPISTREPDHARSTACSQIAIHTKIPAYDPMSASSLEGLV